MKLSVVIVGIVVGLFGLGLGSSSPDQSTQKKNVAETKTRQGLYACSMHPEVVSDKPGKCSKCGMTLKKKLAKPTQKQTLVFVCPMHPEVTSNKPGECPKCGMGLARK